MAPLPLCGADLRPTAEIGGRSRLGLLPGGYRAGERPAGTREGLGMSAGVDPTDGISSWPRVILVEDDQANRRRIRELLTGEGIAVVGEASDGATGVELAQQVQPDVVLMDLRMPIMGGLEATREIKDALPTTQVIVLTSYDGPLPARSAEQAGAYAYLVKGCPGDLMRDVIHQAWKYKLGLQQEQVDQAEGGLAELFGDGSG